jgi:hypothetical protein
MTHAGAFMCWMVTAALFHRARWFSAFGGPAEEAASQLRLVGLLFFMVGICLLCIAPLPP